MTTPEQQGQIVEQVREFVKSAVVEASQTSYKLSEMATSQVREQAQNSSTPQPAAPTQ